MRFSSVRLSRQRLLVVLASVGLVGLVIASLFLSLTRVQAAGNTYYVAPTGNDGNAGTSVGSAFQHIQQCANVIQAGDTCLIESGTYHESVVPANSGTASAPIAFKPDSGATVTVDGADVVTGWTLDSGNVYKANVTLPVASPQDTGFFANQIFADGHMMNEARWPNAGLDLLSQSFALAGSGSNCTTVADSNLPNINWTGASIHLWGASAWTSQTGTVTGSSSGQLTFTGGGEACQYIGMNPGSRYYVSGVKSALDSPTEWYYDGSNHQLFLWTPSGDSPANHTIEAKQRTNAFDLSGRSYVTVQGINLFANTITTSSTSSHDTLTALNAQYLSHFTTLPDPPVLQDSDCCNVVASHELDSGIILNGTANTLSDSVLAYSAGNGVSVQGSNETVTNTVIHDVDYMGSYAAGINLVGSNHTITQNTIYNVARSGINVDDHTNGTSFTNNVIAYNDISRYLLLNEDGGGIYACCSIDASGTRISHNWVHGSSPRTAPGGVHVGIYIDNSSGHFQIDHNVIWNNADMAVFINGNGTAVPSDVVDNNLMFGGNQGSFTINTSDSSGSKYINNIATGSVSSIPDATVANNLGSSTNPQLVDASHEDGHLQSTSPAIDAGQVISGITDGYVGTAPDIGAYEYNGTNWVPGCTLAACTVPTMIDDGSSGGGQNQFNYTGSGWYHSTDSSQGFYQDTLSYDKTANDAVTLAFTGVGIKLYGAKGSPQGIAAVSLDGGAETLVDFYAPVLTSAHGNQLLWVGPTLTPGNHTLKIRVTGIKDASSTDTWIDPDRADILTALGTVDDNVQGSGSGQFGFNGSGWFHCSGSCGGTAYFNSTISYDHTTNDTMTFSFTGGQVMLYAGLWSGVGGIAAIAVDGGPETTLDVNTNGVSQGNQLVWRSAALSVGSHTITVRVTGAHNSGSSDSWIPLDRIDYA